MNSGDGGHTENFPSVARNLVSMLLRPSPRPPTLSGVTSHQLPLNQKLLHRKLPHPTAKIP